MRCPSCEAENDDGAGRCSACGAALGRRPRRRQLPEPESPFSPNVPPADRGAARAYRTACLGLVPGLGLVLGPVAAAQGGLARARGKGDPEFTAQGLATAAIVLGLLIGLTNWLGLYLMVVGLRSPGG
jgi:hypothetical protein